MDSLTLRTSILASRYRLPVLLAYIVTNTALHTAWWRKNMRVVYGGLWLFLTKTYHRGWENHLQPLIRGKRVSPPN
jgi:hypothetical protein